MQIGSGGTCLDGSWGQVPVGCSVQSGGSWTARYKTSTDNGAGCIHSDYQLVCLPTRYYREVVCESVKYQKSPCEIAGYVTNVYLKTQRSEADCIKYLTYGFANGDVWADKGCRGEFIVNMQEVYTVEKECQSYSYRHYRYRIDGVINVEPKIIYKGCTEDYSYGFNEYGIWCRKNCRANFIVTVKV